MQAALGAALDAQTREERELCAEQAQRHAVSEYWRLWLDGQVSNAVVFIQHRDGTWRCLTESHVPNPQPRNRRPNGEGRYRGPEATLACNRD